jgi:hypothetical protein
VSDTVVVVAELGPALLTAIVYVMSAFGEAVAGPVLVIDRFAPLTVAVDVEELFAAFGSAVVELTVAVFETAPVTPEPIVYVLVIVTTPEGAIEPRLHGYAVTQPPLFDTKVRPAGVVSATDTPVAVPDALVFVTVTVYVIVAPGVPVAGPDFTMDRSSPLTVAVDVEELFAAFRSKVVELTVAVFETEPVNDELML